MSKRITVKNNEFTVNGKKIWINGTNTPWNKWNDFGGAYDDSWWDGHFKALHENGVNAVRVWINCNNDQEAVIIDDTGAVSGVSEAHLNDLDMFFETAERNNIYIMATLLSFDHYKSKSAHKWRNMLKNNNAVDSFVNNYVAVFVNRFKDNPYLWSIDLMNEPDWVFENPECGNIPWEQISNLFARAAAAIHENSDILVTVGLSFPKYNADGPQCEGNKVSDGYLQSLYPNRSAYLDFWSPHYYDWVGKHYGVPFYMTPGNWRLDPSKPALLGECSARGSKDNTLISDFENAYKNGWQGVMPWTSNGVDGNGGFDELASAVKYMFEKYFKNQF
jgi:endo-1,4-beta-mannosidase